MNDRTPQHGTRLGMARRMGLSLIQASYNAVAESIEELAALAHRPGGSCGRSV
ncbi:MAG TPA: hypothetical protein VD866_17830 [Urbifossiella sp.]|nr:hypothetical protein [Urbifossiella sp.]